MTGARPAQAVTTPDLSRLVTEDNAPADNILSEKQERRVLGQRVSELGGLVEEACREKLASLAMAVLPGPDSG